MLTTSQNQGNLNNCLYFKEIGIKDLNDSFNIVMKSDIIFDKVKSNFIKDD